LEASGPNRYKYDYFNQNLISYLIVQLKSDTILGTEYGIVSINLPQDPTKGSHKQCQNPHHYHSLIEHQALEGILESNLVSWDLFSIFSSLTMYKAHTVPI